MVNVFGVELAENIDHLSRHRNVATPCSFYLYYDGYCSDELSALVSAGRVAFTQFILGLF